MQVVALFQIDRSSRVRGTARQGFLRRVLCRMSLLTASGLVGATIGWAEPPAPTQLPTGEQVVGGAATIGRQPATMTIDQHTARAAIDWHSFDIGRQAHVEIRQPGADSVLLNRILGDQPTQIFGHLSANGQVYVTNPNGFYFAPSASVNVGGLVATTHRLSLDDFLTGRERFTRQGTTGRILNEGALHAALGGYIALLAPEVRNHGVIVAELGTVALAAGEAYELRFDPLRRLEGLRVDPATIATVVENRQAVLAPGGRIVLSALGLNHVQGGVVKTDGLLEASSLVSRGGRILLEGEAITLGAQSHTRATGATGGGEVLVGGGWQGSGDMHQATTVAMEAGATLDVSATQHGDGGTAVLWSDVHNPASMTSVQGTVRARGGEQDGQGGRIETSGSQVEIDGATIDAGASQGAGGHWLIDPYNYTINAGAASTIATSLGTDTDVTIDTTNNTGSGAGASGVGDITVTSAVTKSSGTGTATLQLRAHGSITVSSPLTATSGKLNVILLADQDGSGAGLIDVGANISTNGGGLWMGGNYLTNRSGSTSWVPFAGAAALTVGDGYAAAFGSVGTGVQMRSGVTLETNGGNVAAYGYSTGAESGVSTGLSLNRTTVTTGGGDLFFEGISNYSSGSVGVAKGVAIHNGSIVSTDAGQLSIRGELKSTSNFTNGVGLWIGHNFSATPPPTNNGSATLSTTSGAITLSGIGADSGGSSWRNGLMAATNAAGDQISIRSISGAITLDGQANFSAATTDTVGLLFQVDGMAVTSQTGAITLRGSNSQETVSSESALRFTAGNTTGALKIGYDGTNPYSGNMLIEGDSITQLNTQAGSGSISVQSDGGLTIQPKGTTFTRLSAGSGTLTFDNDWNFGTSLSSLTIGKSTNTLALTLSNALSVAGSISLYGGDITVSQNIDTSSAGAGHVRLKATGNIILDAARSIRTNGGDAILWSDSDNSGAGGIHLKADAAIDTRTTADRTAGTHTTGGGKIVLAGGLDDAGVSSGIGRGVAGDGTPDGYAVNLTGTSAGVLLGNFSTSAHDTNINLFSGGGDILLNGRSTQQANSLSLAVQMFQGTTIHAGQNGNITMFGDSNMATSIAAGFDIASYRADLSNAATTIQTVSGNILMSGKARNGTNENFGLTFDTSTNTPATIQATGSGSITLRGDAVGSASIGLRLSSLDVLAASGALSLDSVNGSISLNLLSDRGVFLASRPGTSVTSSSSNVLLRADAVTIQDGLAINTTGHLTIEPTSNSFTSALSWPWSLTNFGSTLGGLTIGKPTNTANVTIASTQTVAGPISLYGGDMALNANLTSSNTGDIFIKSNSATNESVTLQSAASILKTGGARSRLTLQGDGRLRILGQIVASNTPLDVVLWSDYGNSGKGGVSIMNNVTTNGGHLWAGGSTNNGGSSVWNGLTVGDGPSVGNVCCNYNAMDLRDILSTGGGDVLLWGGNGYSGGTDGVGLVGNATINAGSGHVTVIGDQILGGSNKLTLNSTGRFTWAPDGGNFGSAFTWSGSTSGGNFTGTGSAANLIVNGIANLGGLTIGHYTGTGLVGDTALTGFTNSSDITVSSAASIAGPISLYGGNIALNANLTTTNASTGDIAITTSGLTGNGGLALASGRNLTITQSETSQYGGVMSGVSAAVIKAGAGALTLTANETYTGATTISAGTLQIGTGGTTGSLATSSVTNNGTLVFNTGANTEVPYAISGSGNVEVVGAARTLYTLFLTTTPTTIATNTTVAEVLARLLGARENGAAVSSGGAREAGIYVKQFDPLTNTATFQVQQIDTTLTKTVFVKLSQSGTSVQAVADTSGLHTNGTAYKSGNNLGADMSTGSIYTMPFATSAGANGYGVDRFYESSKLTLTGNNSYAGTTTIRNTTTNTTSPNMYAQTAAGIVEIGAGGNLGSGDVDNAGLLIFNDSTAKTVSNNMSGAGSLLKNGSNTLTMDHALLYTGDTIVNAGTLQVGAGGTTGSLASGSQISLPFSTATLTVNRSDSLTMGNAIQGLGVFAKAGTNRLTLTSDSLNATYNIDGGDLIVENNAPSIVGTVNGPGALTIQPAGSSFSAPLIWPLGGLTLSGTVGGLTLGRSSNTANVTIGSATSIAGPITLYGGTLTINAPLTATGTNTIILQGTGTVTDGTGGYLVADRLALLGGAVTLDHASNNVGTLAASGVGALTYVDSNALTIGTVGATSGVNATGLVRIETPSGDLTVAGNLATTSTSTSAIILNAGKTMAAGTATGGNLLVSGSPSLTVGSGGRATFYSGSVSGSTGLAALIGSGSGRFRYNSDESATNYTAALGTGLYGIYRERPTVGVTGDNKTMTYGDALPTWTYTTSGTVNGDTITQIFASPNLLVGGTLSTSGNPIVGGHALTASGMTTSQLGYGVGTVTNGTLTVTAKALTYTGTAANKVYDGTTVASLTHAASGVVAGDVVTLSGSGAFADKHMGTNKTVSVSGIGLSGDDGSNYTLGSTASMTADITAKTLIYTGTAADKVYDGTTVASLTHAASGIVAGDAVTVNGPGTGAFADKHVETNKTVSMSGIALSGVDSSNYSLGSTASTTADITAKAVTVSGLTAVNKVYDGTTGATVNHSGVSFSGLVAGDLVTASGTSGSFATKAVGTGRTVTLSGATYGGADAGNYTFTDQASATADITAKAVTVSGLTAANKVYDGNTSTTVNHSGVSFSGLVTGDTVTASGTSGSFATKAVGTGKTVTLSGTTYGGADAGNYAFTDQTSTTADITAKAVTVSGLTAANKVYDGTTSATVRHSGVSFGGLVAGDTVTLSGTNGSFATKQVGTGKTVTLSGTMYGGADAGNYAFTNQTSTTADITTKALTIDLQGQGSRVYDGGTAITLSGVTPMLMGVLGGDAVTVASGNVTGFVDKQAGTNKAVTYTGFDLSGADATNYVLTSGGASSTASITPLAVTVSGLTAQDKYYDGTTAATITHGGAVFAGMIAGDHLAASGTVGTFTDPAVERGKAVALQGTVYGGVDAGNYVFVDQTSTTASILDLSTSPVVQTQLNNPLGGTTQLSRGLQIVPGSPTTMPPRQTAPVRDLTTTTNGINGVQLTSLVPRDAQPDVMMTVFQKGSSFEPSLILVTISHAMIAQEKAVTFSLPEELTEAWGGYPQRFTQTNAETLPTGIIYDQRAGTFQIQDPDLSTFPLELLGTIKDHDIYISLSVQALDQEMSE